jgi:hypothetical protein
MMKLRKPSSKTGGEARGRALIIVGYNETTYLSWPMAYYYSTNTPALQSRYIIIRQDV